MAFCVSEPLKAADRMPKVVVDRKEPRFNGCLTIVSARVVAVDSPSLTLLNRVFALLRSGEVCSSLMKLVTALSEDFLLTGLTLNGLSWDYSDTTCSVVSMTSVT